MLSSSERLLLFPILSTSWNYAYEAIVKSFILNISRMTNIIIQNTKYIVAQFLYLKIEIEILIFSSNQLIKLHDALKIHYQSINCIEYSARKSNWKKMKLVIQFFVYLPYNVLQKHSACNICMIAVCVIICLFCCKKGKLTRNLIPKLTHPFKL